MRYEIIESTNILAFAEIVELRIGRGWELMGGVSVIQDEDYCTTYYQAMTTNNHNYPSASIRAGGAE